jgi:uncharacterized membrane protein YccC
MLQLGYFEALGDWEYINQSPAKLQAVSAEDIQRVANKYFDWSNRAVATYVRKAGSETMDPELAALDPRLQAQAKQILAKLKEYDLENLQRAVAAMEAQAATVPPQAADLFKYVLKKAHERIKQLEAPTVE